MGNKPHFLYFLLLLSAVATVAGAYGYGNSPTKLFLFGDSYADTGNRNFTASSWHKPYGITYPGRPFGHYSDGRVFTEYIASRMGIPSPIPYRFRKKGPIEYGMNFAIGGAGVFQTVPAAPNMTAQIRFLEELVEEKIYTNDDLSSSIALVALSGNDYYAYIIRGGNLLGLPAFIESVVKQLGANLRLIRNMGVPRIAVMGLQPLGCLPEFTLEYSYEKCNETANFVAWFHNALLTAVVKDMNLENDESDFVMLDMFDAFMSAMKKHEKKSDLKTTLTPCCAGITSNYSCGNVEKRVKKYTVCEDPELAFYWDSFHPTQAGWEAIFSVVTFSKLFHTELWGSF